MPTIMIQGPAGSGKSFSAKGFTKLSESQQGRILHVSTTGSVPFPNHFSKGEILTGTYGNYGTSIEEELLAILAELKETPKKYLCVVIDSLTDVLYKEEAYTINNFQSKDTRQAYKFLFDKTNHIMNLINELGKLCYLYCVCTSNTVAKGDSMKHKAVVSGKHGDLGLERHFEYVVRCMQLSEKNAKNYIQKVLEVPRYKDMSESEVFPVTPHTFYADFYYCIKTVSTDVCDTISTSGIYPEHNLYVNNNMFDIFTHIKESKK